MNHQVNLHQEDAVMTWNGNLSGWTGLAVPLVG